LQAQRVLAALAQDLGIEDAKEKFKRIFLTKKNPYIITSPHSVDGVDDDVNRDGIVGMKKGEDTSIVLDKDNDASSSN